MSAYTVVMTDKELQAGPTGEELWLAKRKGFIGASESAAILGLSPWSTPLDVWWSKQPGTEPIEETRHMMWGKRLEPVVAEWTAHDYADRVGTVLPSPGLLASRDLPWLSATPDRELSWDEDGFVTGVLELKNSSAFGRHHWFEDGEETVPPYYEVQVQQQMHVRGIRRGFISCLLGGNELVLREVRYSPEFIELLVSELDEWRQKYLLTGEAPPATRRDVHRFDGAPKGAPDAQITASEAIAALVEQRNVISAAAGRIKKADEQVKGEIQAFMGDRTELLAPDGTILATWYAGKPREVFLEAQFKSDHPNLWVECSRPGERIFEPSKLEALDPEIYRQYVGETPAGGRRMLFKGQPNALQEEAIADAMARLGITAS